MPTAVCDLLDTMSSTVRQQAGTIILRQRAPANPFESRLRPSRSAVVGGPYHDAMNIAQNNAQYRHFRGRVYSAVRVYAQRISSQPIYVAHKRREGSKGKSLRQCVRDGDISRFEIPQWAVKGIDLDQYEILESHELAATLEEPNSLMVQQTMMEFLVYNLLITGISHLMVAQSEQRGRKYDLVPVPTTWVKPDWQGGKIARWFVGPPGDTDPLPVESKYMLRFFLPDPSNPTAAISPMNMLAHAILNDESIAEAQHANFRNEGAPSVALIAGEDADMVIGGGRSSGLASLTPEQRQEIVDWFRQEYADVSRHGLPMVLDNIIKDIKILARTPKDMAFLESAGVTKEQIFEGYGVPAVAAGQIENVTRESSATAEGHLLRNAINPTIRMMSQVMKRGLVPLYAGRQGDLVVWIAEAQPEDPDLRLRWFELACKYFAADGNDIRRECGLKPKDGFDVHFVPQRSRAVRMVDGEPIEVLHVGDAEAENAEDVVDDMQE